MKRATDLINQTGSLTAITSCQMLDHSLLKWNIDSTKVFQNEMADANKPDLYSDTSEENVQFELVKMPENFLTDDLTLCYVNDIIIKLESRMRTQTDIDNVYADWCNILNNRMLENISHGAVTINVNARENPHGLKSCLTYGLGYVGLKSYGWRASLEVRNKNLSLHKQFDREVQGAKRLHWHSLQKSLLDECNVDQSQFWKSIGKIGISCTNKKGIPTEIVLDDGSVSLTISDVLRKWQSDLSSLFNSTNQSGESGSETVQNTRGNLNDSNESLLDAYNDHISIFEVTKTIDDAKGAKATGIDNIPVEDFKNDTAVSFLHILFNICFDNGFMPSD